MTAVHTFKNLMKEGDIVIVSDGNHKFRAIGQITGKYKSQPREDLMHFWQARDVEWLKVYSPSRPKEDLLDVSFSQMTVYQLKPGSINMKKLQSLLNHVSGPASSFEAGKAFGGKSQKYTITKNTDDILELLKPNGSKLSFSWEMLNQLAGHVKSGTISLEDIQNKQVFEKIQDTDLEKYIVNGYNNILAPIVSELITTKYSGKPSEAEQNKSRVLIIDEINRGNIAKIFGELITLIEENKRSGEAEAVSVTLPYSKEEFSVPTNLYLIGTMNTADRSLTSIDAALRRRFKFDEVMPDASLLADISIEGIDFVKMLQIINYRIEALLGREYLVGHSYFLPLKNDQSLGKLQDIFGREIIPLLKEYFFDDWEKMHRILGDHQKPRSLQMIRRRFDDDKVAQLIGEDWQGAIDTSWEVSEEALSKPDAYTGIYQKVLKLYEVESA